jgi:hypothetical protein
MYICTVYIISIVLTGFNTYSVTFEKQWFLHEEMLHCTIGFEFVMAVTTKSMVFRLVVRRKPDISDEHIASMFRAEE